MNWQLAEAKNKFSDLIHRALTKGLQKLPAGEWKRQ